MHGKTVLLNDLSLFRKQILNKEKKGVRIISFIIKFCQASDYYEFRFSLSYHNFPYFALSKKKICTYIGISCKFWPRVVLVSTQFAKGFWNVAIFQFCSRANRCNAFQQILAFFPFHLGYTCMSWTYLFWAEILRSTHFLCFTYFSFNDIFSLTLHSAKWNSMLSIQDFCSRRKRKKR